MYAQVSEMYFVGFEVRLVLCSRHIMKIVGRSR
jgi:hypothetical protein